MKTDELFEYRSARKAVAIVDHAADTMRPAEIAVALDVAESTIRMWRSKPETVIDAATARKVRRLERRLK